MLFSLAYLFSFSLGSAAADDIPLHGQSQVHFATVAEGRELLRQRDSFVNRLSRFDLQSRMKTDKELQISEFWDFVSAEVMGWEPDEVARMKALVESLRERCMEYELPFPNTVVMIKTTGKEEADAAYTRGHAIVFPQRVLNLNRVHLEKLLAHELFHVLSRANEPLRTKLYAIIGFLPCNEITLPVDLRDRKITNPDAPSIEHRIQLEINDKLTNVVPVLYASVDQYDPQIGGSFFKYLTFRMLVVEEREGRWIPLLAEGNPVLFDPRKLPAYLEKIGKNTKYIIHPDEILADNFVHLVMETNELESPHIVDQMRQFLKAETD